MRNSTEMPASREKLMFANIKFHSKFASLCVLVNTKEYKWEPSVL